MQSDFNRHDRETPIDDAEKLSDLSDNAKEASYGGFKYKWEYDAYQETARNKTAVKDKSAVDVLLVCLTAFFVFCVIAISAVIVLDIHRNQESSRQPISDTEEAKNSLPVLSPETFLAMTDEVPSENMLIDAVCIEKLGIAGQVVTNDLSDIYRIPCGFLVKNIYGISGSDIKKSGLQQGDIIVSIDSFPIKESEEIEDILLAHITGDTLLICVYRNEAYIDLAVTYTRSPEEGSN